MSVKPWDMLNPHQKRAPEDVVENRYNICQGCEHLIKITHQCSKCGCFMKMKTQLSEATCPMGKWGKYEENKS